jgi:hypothetical protein
MISSSKLGFLFKAHIYKYYFLLANLIVYNQHKKYIRYTPMMTSHLILTPF